MKSLFDIAIDSAFEILRFAENMGIETDSQHFQRVLALHQEAFKYTVEAMKKDKRTK